MNTGAHTFMDVFGSTFQSGDQDVVLERIVIPILQRDYAQGRPDKEIRRVRDRFLASLRSALVSDPITLDFIYGDIDDKGTMTPLDGQQRLTTLFLLHWFAAKREGVDEGDCGLLSRFSYETRYSARDFCEKLVSFRPDFDSAPAAGNEERKTWLSHEIRDQHWFPMSWEHDPTVASMLTMLDAIFVQFDDLCRPRDATGLWERLKEGRISFYLLPIRDMGLTDELYIKMNSRGKPLTAFEHFKAELEQNLLKAANIADQGQASEATELAHRISYKIDTSWTDLLWTYRDDAGTIDDGFLRYFTYICDILCYESGGTPQGRSSDPLDLLDEYFPPDGKRTLENALKLESYFDCWLGNKAGGSPLDFQSKFMSTLHEEGKTTVNDGVDVFRDCLREYGSYSDVVQRTRKFTLRKTILLYALTTYLRSEAVTADQFARRLRIVWNLVRNSDDQISDSESRSGGNRMPEILRQVYTVVRMGKVPLPNAGDTGNGFNPYQLEEEAEKALWVGAHPDLAEQLYALEDHKLLEGQVGIVGLDHSDLFGRFASLFSCDRDLVACALLSLGDYAQQSKRTPQRWQIGASERDGAWENLFHRSRDSGGFEKTRDVLVELLSSEKEFSDEKLRGIIEAFLASCEDARLFDWRYYYVNPKYQRFFRLGRYGKLWWDGDHDKEQYLMRVMATNQRVSENSTQPYLMAATAGIEGWKSEREGADYGYGMSVVNDVLGQRICCDNDSFVFRDAASGQELRRLEIEQRNGIDCENRIEKLRSELLIG